MCGMTREEDIAYAASLGVDAIGLVFSPQSPRFVSLNQAKRLLQKLPLFVDAVAVLVNPEPSFVEELITELPISWLQFHGDESPEFCQQFGKPYIKAIQVDSAAAIYKSCEGHHQASAILLDTPSASSRGGTGKTFDWSLIPDNLSKPFILAGGLNVANIKDALRSCSPYAVDVSSGIEESPGIKDHKKMKQFVDAVWGKA